MWTTTAYCLLTSSRRGGYARMVATGSRMRRAETEMAEDKKRTLKFKAHVSTAVVRTWYNNDEFVGIDGRDVFCHIDPNMLIYCLGIKITDRRLSLRKVNVDPFFGQFWNNAKTPEDWLNQHPGEKLCYEHPSR